MPVRATSSAWKRAIHSLPERAASRSSSRPASWPSRITPPSCGSAGGFVGQGGVQRLAQLGAGLQQSLQFAQQLRPGGRPGRPGRAAAGAGSGRRRNRSRGDARPVAGAGAEPVQVGRLAPAARAAPPQRRAPSTNSPTASSRASMAARSVSGASRLSCNSRAPMRRHRPVQVRQQRPSRLPSRRVRVSSRLRRVASSRSRWPSGRYGRGRAGGPGWPCTSPASTAAGPRRRPGRAGRRRSRNRPPC